MIKTKIFSLSKIVERNIGFSVALFVIVFCAVCFFKAQHPRPFVGDAVQYVRAAYHLAYSGVYSYSRGRVDPEPVLGRAPGYSIFIAGVIKAFPGLDNTDLNWAFLFHGGEGVPGPVLNYIKHIQAGLLLMMAFMAAWMVWNYLGRIAPAYLTLWFVGFNPFLAWYIELIYREVLAAFFFTSFSLMLYLALKRRRLLYYVFSGGFLGLLTLTMAQWKYVGGGGLIAIAFCVVLKKDAVVKGLLGLFLLSVVWVATFYPWELRNEQLFGYKTLSAGGGLVLELRSQYNLMPASSYWVAFPYWGGGAVSDKVAEIVDKKSLLPLMRMSPDGYYSIAKKKREKIVIEKGGIIEADAHLKQEALARIKENWGHHLMMTLPMGLRLMGHPVFGVLYVPVYIFFILGAYYTLRNKDWGLLAILSPPLVLFCFNVLATHALPRYNAVATPIFIFGAVVGFIFYRERKAG